MSKSYDEKLREHLDERPYRPETILSVNRIVHVGSVSAQSALEIIEALEGDRLATDCEMRGMDDFDRVFYPQNSIELE